MSALLHIYVSHVKLKARLTDFNRSGGSCSSLLTCMFSSSRMGDFLGNIWLAWIHSRLLCPSSSCRKKHCYFLLNGKSLLKTTISYSQPTLSCSWVNMVFDISFLPSLLILLLSSHKQWHIQLESRCEHTGTDASGNIMIKNFRVFIIIRFSPGGPRPGRFKPQLVSCSPLVVSNCKFIVLHHNSCNKCGHTFLSYPLFG